jgi:hypothetical protein
VYIGENYTTEEIAEKLLDVDIFQEELNDQLWIEDSVTGNGSGSYTFSTWKAEEYICHNLDLLREAAMEFGCDVDILKKGAEYCDVTIRCYLLSQAIAETLEELQMSYGTSVPF